VAKKAAVMKPDGSTRTDGEGKLIAVTGPIEGEATIGDPDYLKAGPYVALRREAEMFAWVEKVTTTKEKKVGGGSRETKTYNYEKKWTSRPQSSDDFRYPDGHENPAPRVRSDSWTAPSAHIGVYAFPPDEIQLPPSRAIAI